MSLIFGIKDITTNTQKSKAKAILTTVFKEIKSEPALIVVLAGYIATQSNGLVTL